MKIDRLRHLGTPLRACRSDFMIKFSAARVRYRRHEYGGGHSKITNPTLCPFISADKSHHGIVILQLAR